MSTSNSPDSSDSLIEFTSKMLNNPEKSDVWFEFNDGVRYSGHKLILSRSSVFKRMFNGGDWKETTSDNVVKIDEIPPGAFFEFLRFIYSDDVNLTEENLIWVYYAAHKYDVNLLEAICLDFLDTHLNEHNAIHFFEHLRNYENAAEECLHFIDVNIDKLILNKSLFEISEEMLIQILYRDSLDLSEFELFQFALKWSEKVSRPGEDMTIRKKKYFAVFQLLRFPAMGAADFIQSFKFAPNFFTPEETHSILKYCTTKEDDNLIYSTVIRRCGFKTVYFENDETFQRGDNVKTLKFRVNEIIEIQSFCASYHPDAATKKFVLKLFDQSILRPIFSTTVSVLETRIRSRDRIILYPNKFYTLYTESDRSLKYSAYKTLNLLASCSPEHGREFVFPPKFETHIDQIRYKVLNLKRKRNADGN